ncbi:hypothetical protein AAE478_009109 [Parahypoxylon ruwenzoriense]
MSSTRGNGLFLQIEPTQQSQGTQDFADFVEKKPFELRANPFINKDHPEFLRIEDYFMRLLRKSKYTIEEILENTFDPYEIQLFEPADPPSELATQQKENALRYQRILETRFKGHPPSLQLKMAFLYFGLPVAPMKPGGLQVHALADLDFAEDNLRVKPDPLEFLDDYTEKTNGNPRKRVKNKDFPDNPPTQVFPSSSLSLRGGALLSDPLPREDPTSVAGNASEPPGFFFRIFGYQGSILTDRHYGHFVKAIDQLLGMGDQFNYSVCLQIWDTSSLDTRRHVDQAVGMIYHDKEEPPAEDKLFALTKKWINEIHGERYGCFVHFDKEEKPGRYQPHPQADRYIVGLWDADRQNMAYMKIPRNFHSAHMHNQIIPEYVRAMRVLYPKVPHKYLQFGSDGRGLTYGLLDPPPEIWTGVVTTQKDGIPELPLVNFETIDIPRDYVAVIVPGSYFYNTDFSSSGKLLSRESGIFHKNNLKVSGTEKDRESLSKFIEVVSAANRTAMTSTELVGVDVWAPGEAFLERNVEPTRIHIRGDGEMSLQTLLDWRLAMAGFQAPRIHSSFTNVCIVAQPVFESYRVRAKRSSSHISIRLKEFTLSEFKAEVKSRLLPEYQSDDRRQSLHLVQTGWSLNRTEFVIRAETDEDEWKMIVRRITEPGITVALEAGDSSWVVEEKTAWGPRYDSVNPSRSSNFQTTYRPRPFSEPINQFFRGSVNTTDGASRAQELRERLFWDIPSVFTNPAKPALPIHAAPVETIIKTGPNMPGYTIAMRTPSEVARLEREVHTLRGHLLDRIRECPYLDCGRYFPFSDGEGLARHLREAHQTLACFLCPGTRHIFPYFDHYSIRQHFLSEHYDDLKKLFGVPDNVADQAGHIIVTNYCHSCGRDQFKLKNPKDRMHHHRVCEEPSQRGLIVGPTAWCRYCGRALQNGHTSCECGLKSFETFDPGNFCPSCGLEYDSTMDRGYREIHKNFCKHPSGKPNDCCAYCGIVLKDKNDDEKRWHMQSCMEKSSSSSPTEFITALLEPEVPGPPDIVEIKIEDEEVSPLQAEQKPKPRNQSSSGQNIPKTVTTNTVKKVGFRDTVQKPKPPRKPTGKTEKAQIKDNATIWTEASPNDEVPSRRPRSPDWTARLEREGQLGLFQPEPASRCSRCFRAAGDNPEEIEEHMNPSGSCRIRRGYGTSRIGWMPNRSGWIPAMEQFNFNDAYYNFIDQFPAYKYTMFPIRPSSVMKVWEEPFNLEAAVGSFKDDPNNPDTTNVHALSRSRELPWPPFEGTVIPLWDLPVPEDEEIYPETENSEDTMESEDQDVTVKAGQKISPQKRKRAGEVDPAFPSPVGVEEGSDEYSEGSAVTDPIENLAADAPPTPKKRDTKKPGRTEKAGSAPPISRAPFGTQKARTATKTGSEPPAEMQRPEGSMQQVDPDWDAMEEIARQQGANFLQPAFTRRPAALAASAQTRKPGQSPKGVGWPTAPPTFRRSERVANAGEEARKAGFLKNPGGRPRKR